MIHLLFKIRSYIKVSTLGRYIRRKKRSSLILSEKWMLNEITKHMGNATDIEKKRVFDDIQEMARKYLFDPSEYFYYNFKEKTLEERLSFVPDIIHNELCEQLNKPYNQYIFDDKGSTARVFCNYYFRDYCVVMGGGKISDNFNSFVNRHG